MLRYVTRTSDSKNKSQRVAKTLPQALLNVTFALCKPPEYFLSFRLVCKTWCNTLPLWIRLRSEQYNVFTLYFTLYPARDVVWTAFLTHLELGYIGPESVIAVVLKTCPKLTSLSVLDSLENSNVGDALMKSNIDTLVCGGVSIDFVEYLAAMPRLKHLSLMHPHFEVSEHHCKKLNKLKSLESLCMNPKQRDDKLIVYSTELSRLQSLNIGLWRHWRHESLGNWAACGFVSTLKILHLFYNGACSTFTENISLFGALEELCLTLSWDYDFCHLQKLRYLKVLKLESDEFETVTFNGTACGNLVARLLLLQVTSLACRDLYLNSKLNILDLTVKTLSDPTWNELVSWTTLQKLTVYTLPRMRGLSFHELVYLKTLIVLNPSDWAEFDIDLISTFPALETLHYDSSDVTEAILTKLAKNQPNLRSLFLGDLRRAMIDFTFLHHLPTLGHLTIKVIDETTVHELVPKCVTLTSLEIHWYWCVTFDCDDDYFIHDVETLFTLPRLRKLSLPGTMFKTAERLRPPSSIIKLEKYHIEEL